MTNRIIAYDHFPAEHCETGAIRNLLHFYGCEMSEAMIFGIGSGLFFIHVPFLRHEKLPLTMFRTTPVSIFKNVARITGIKLYHHRFINRDKSMRVLDELVEKNIPVGLVVSLAELAYFPFYLRGEFNGHHIVIIGKEDDDYYVSDTFPQIEGIQKISKTDLLKVRYTESFLSPRGEMFYITRSPQNINMKEAIKKGIKKTCRLMLYFPSNKFGVDAIFLLAKRIRRLESKEESEKKKRLRQIVRLAEEAGTGGSGFRRMYATFLKESAELLQNNELKDASQKMDYIADLWRNLSVEILRYVKNRRQEKKEVNDLSDMVFEIAKEEKNFFTELKEIEL